MKCRQRKYLENRLKGLKKPIRISQILIPSSNDKIVLKVNKATSHTMLSLVTFGPSYVSPNVTVGYEEATKFFPESYKTAEQELEENMAKEKSGNK